jgi:hypothetical protein
VASGAIVTSGTEVVPSNTSASGTTPSTGMALGSWYPRFVFLSSQSVLCQYPGATSTTRGGRHHRSLRTFHYGGLQWHSLCAWRNGLHLREGSGLLNSWRRISLSSCCTGFFTFPGQIGGLPAQYKFGDQPSKITNLYLLLEDELHLQARPDNSHG